MGTTKQVARGSLAIWLVVFLFIAMAPSAAAVWTPLATTSENNALPTGLALPDSITANLAYQTSAPTGTSAPSARTSDGSEVTTQPAGTAAPNPRDNTGAETNIQPTGTSAPSARTSDGSEVTTQPAGTAAPNPRDNTGGENTGVITGAVTIVANTAQAKENTTTQTGIPAPTAQSKNGTVSTTQCTGVPVSSEVAITLSVQGGLGVNEPAGVGSPSDAENKWYAGTWTFRNINISVIVDDNGSGVFDDVYLDCDADGVWAEGTDNKVGYTAGVIANEDIANVPTQTTWGEAAGNKFTFDNIRFEDKIDSTAAPTVLYVRSDTWVIGTFPVDVNSDATADTLYYVIADSNSDGKLDGVYLSENDDYNDGTLNDNIVSATDDENVASADVGVRSIRIGDRYKFKVTALHENAQLATITTDISITIDNYYTGQVWIDTNGDGTTDAVNFCFTDENSDGIFDNIYVSVDTTYNNGTLTDGVVTAADDEVVKVSENLRIDNYRYYISGPNPPGDTTDISVLSQTWWYGQIYLDVDGNGTVDNPVYFLLSDNDSNGVFNVLEISSDDNTFGEGLLTDDNAWTDNDARITATGNVRIGTGAAQQYQYQATLIGDPADNTSLTYDFRLTSTSWYTGTLSIDVNGDGAADTVNFSLSDSNSDGVFDSLDISSDDTTYGEGALNDSDAYTDDDARITATGNVRIGTGAAQSYQYSVVAPVRNPIGTSPDYSVTSTSWWTGVVAIDTNGDGIPNNVNFALSDGNSDGVFDALDISSDDTMFGEGLLTDDNAWTDNDARITATGNVRIGTGAAQQYRYQATLVGNPAGATLTYDFRLTSTSWYTGTLSIDVNDDGAADTVNFALSDGNSDGVFDALDISGDTTYGEGTLNDNKVSTTGGVTEDERITAAVSLFKFGDNNQFSIIAPVGNPIGTTPDFSVTSSSWYTGSVQVEMTGDSTLDNLYITLLDGDSDGVFDNYYLSAFNTTYGQGTATDNLIADNLNDNNDERLSAATDNLHLGPQRVRYEVFALVANPQAQAIDFRMRAKSWYVGTITLHAGNTFDFVIWDNNADGVFDNLVFDDNSDGSFSGDPVYNSYPATAYLPRNSQYAYNIVWFNRNPAYADATYGAYDLVMQPLDTAPPAFSSASPSQGIITTDTMPTISVALSDQATGGYLFGIYSIRMQVRGVTVSHTYSGGVVSYTPSTALSDGEVSISVTATDYANNSASTSWSFTVIAETATVVVDSGVISLPLGRMLPITAIADSGGTVVITAVSEAPATTPAGYMVYGYVDISVYGYVDISAATRGGGTVIFGVSESWFASNGVDRVGLLKYTGVGWQELSASYAWISGGYRYYSARVPNFSVFAIAGVAVEEQVPVPIPQGPTDQASQAIIIGAIGAVIILLMVLIAPAVKKTRGGMV